MAGDSVNINAVIPVFTSDVFLFKTSFLFVICKPELSHSLCRRCKGDAGRFGKGGEIWGNREVKGTG